MMHVTSRSYCTLAPAAPRSTSRVTTAVHFFAAITLRHTRTAQIALLISADIKEYGKLNGSSGSIESVLLGRSKTQQSHGFFMIVSKPFYQPYGPSKREHNGRRQRKN